MTECRRAGKLTNSATTQAQIKAIELAHLKVYLIYKLLEHVKGLVLKIQSFRISMTQGNMITRVLVRILYRRCSGSQRT